MKNSLTLTIATPCSETWDSFIRAKKGAFCNSCAKVVVDFTKMTDDEILDFFSDKQIDTCGRFRHDQLKSYSEKTPLKINPGLTLFKASILIIVMALISKQTAAQNITAKTKTEIVQTVDQEVEKNAIANSGQIVRGIVKDEDNTMLPGVNVILRGSTEGTMTDVEGWFEFPRKLNVNDVLLFSFIGYDTKEYVVPKSVIAQTEINISIKLEAGITMGELTVDGIYAAKPSGFHKLWLKVKGLF